MKKLVIFGNGDMARMADFYFTLDSQYEVVAFTVNQEFYDSKEFQGKPVVTFEDVENLYSPTEYEMYVAIGYSNVNKHRADVYYKAKEKGYKLASYISSKATVFSNHIGENTFIFEDNTIQPFVKIGNNVVLWSGNHIGHDCVIGDHVFITSHVVLSGWTEVGDYSFLGVNATVRDHIKIEKENVIGAGALIVKNTVEKGVYVNKNIVAQLSSVPSDKLRGI